MLKQLVVLYFLICFLLHTSCTTNLSTLFITDSGVATTTPSKVVRLKKNPIKENFKADILSDIHSQKLPVYMQILQKRLLDKEPTDDQDKLKFYYRVNSQNDRLQSDSVNKLVVINRTQSLIYFDFKDDKLLKELNILPALISTQAKNHSSDLPPDEIYSELQSYLSADAISHFTVKEAYHVYNALQNAKCGGISKNTAYDPGFTCAGPPYLYLTFHGGKTSNSIKTVCKFSRNGCSFGSVIDIDAKHIPHSLRGMLLYKSSYLIVVDAWKKKSRLLLYDKCNSGVATRNTRGLLNILAEGSANQVSTMIHPYGITSMPSNPGSYIFVSVQETNSVLRYKAEFNNTADVYALPQKLVLDRVVVELGSDDIRGIAFDKNSYLYVSDKDKGVKIFDMNGVFVQDLMPKITQPIGLYYNVEDHTLWVGSKSKNAIYQYNLANWTLKREILNKKLSHAAGLVAHEDSLYVLVQDSNELQKYSLTTGKFESVLAKFDDRGEGLILSPC